MDDPIELLVPWLHAGTWHTQVEKGMGTGSLCLSFSTDTTFSILSLSSLLPSHPTVLQKNIEMILVNIVITNNVEILKFDLLFTNAKNNLKRKTLPVRMI